MKKFTLFVLPFAALFIAILFWWLQHPQQTQPTQVLPLAKQCDLHQGTCEIKQGNIQIQLSIQPRPIPIAKSLEVNATIQGLAATKVQLDINGTNMYMGYNRTQLHSQDQQHWNGKAMLSFCTIEQMQWQLTLLIDQADGTQIQAPFPLITPYTHK